MLSPWSRIYPQSRGLKVIVANVLMRQNLPIGGDGNVGIIRSPVRAIVSPDHTDNSLLIKYYDRPEKFLDKMAFSFTGDLGCEFGRSMTTSTGQYVQGVGCYRNTKDPNSLGQNTNASNQNTSDPISYQPGIIRRPSSM